EQPEPVGPVREARQVFLQGRGLAVALAQQYFLIDQFERTFDVRPQRREALQVGLHEDAVARLPAGALLLPQRLAQGIWDPLLGHGGWRSLRNRWAAQLFQALAALTPGRSIKYLNRTVGIQLQSRENLGPQDNSLGITFDRNGDREDIGAL